MPSQPCLAVLACCLLLGCGGEGPTTYNVSGTITFKGEPIADAQVGFVPLDSSDLKPARGQTDDQGRYSLRTYLGPANDPVGAMAGEYQVTVIQGIAENRIVEYDDLANHQQNLPPIYADAQTTPLSATVTPDSDNSIDFILKESK